ncbi:HNH endonuclease [Komagataeibacter rhaeticus]|nr:HNH endonuclease [Komagataeibacter rhaeticus]
MLGRLGLYCSYCERRIKTNLAVEHIQPKGVPATAYLETEWTNFLLACVNCNSTKGHKPANPADILLPDRDNTFLAYEYTIDGLVQVQSGITGPTATKAEALLTLTGLNKDGYECLDENGKQIVVDRVSGRIESMAMALEQAQEIANDPTNEALKKRL